MFCNYLLCVLHGPGGTEADTNGSITLGLQSSHSGQNTGPMTLAPPVFQKRGGGKSFCGKYLIAYLQTKRREKKKIMGETGVFQA